MFDLQLAEARAAIITDILQDGVKTSAQLAKEGKRFLGSHDGGPSEYMDHARLPFIRDPINLNKHVQSALYGYHDNCVMTVLLERDYELPVENIPRWQKDLPPNLLDILNRRLIASFVVMAPDLLFDRKSNPQRFEITPDHLLLFPELVWQQFRKVNSTIKAKSPINVSNSAVVRMIGLMQDPLVVPDYEVAAVDFLHEVRSPVWFHVVRLPTVEDLQPVACI